MTTLRRQSVRSLWGTNCWMAGLMLSVLTAYGAAETLSPANSALAAALERPEGRVILKISGLIGVKNSADGAEFDRRMLAALPAVTIETDTPWTDGIIRFEGPLMREILKLVGADGGQVNVTAKNDYSVQIPVDDFESYNVILAMTKDGEPLRTRTKGPL